MNKKSQESSRKTWKKICFLTFDFSFIYSHTSSTNYGFFPTSLYEKHVFTVNYIMRILFLNDRSYLSWNFDIYLSPSHAFSFRMGSKYPNLKKSISPF
jgi:hypothetical protein